MVYQLLFLNWRLLVESSNNKWADIESFKYLYFKEEIKTLKYSVMSVDPSYTAYNDSYVLFYQNSDIELLKIFYHHIIVDQEPKRSKICNNS